MGMGRGDRRNLISSAFGEPQPPAGKEILLPPGELKGTALMVMKKVPRQLPAIGGSDEPHNPQR
jgi:hypothetical protein